MVVVIIAVWSSSNAMSAIDEKTVLYMSFNNDIKGAVVNDESGYKNDGNVVGNGAKWTKSGKFGGAVEFDGASKIEIAHSDSLNLSKAFTLELWFKTNVAQKGKFLMYKSHVGAGRNYEWGIYLTADSTAVSVYTVKPNDEVASIGKSGANYMDNNWHSLAGIFDGKILKCYVDGEIQKIDFVSDIRTSVAPVVIGTWATAFFTGAIDEVRICNVALTDDQVKADFDKGYIPATVNSTDRLSTAWGQIKAER
jgi:hypothetical protein